MRFYDPAETQMRQKATDMCGITGFLDCGTDKPADRLERVSRSVAAMRHRGPDDAVTAEVGPAGAWGMCRLAIRDPSPNGRQPFWHGDIGVIFNGEIYNTSDLKRRLEERKHSFQTRCDTEVLLKTYVEYGSAAFGLLDGIFAVALVNLGTNEFTLARDEFGVKPLFVSSSAGKLAFASEPKGLDALGALDGGIDYEQLIQYLRYQYVPEPGTPWSGVRKLGRGTCEVYSLDRLELQRTERFTQPREEKIATHADANSWLAATEVAVKTSVRRQLVSDRPLGIFLSGGIDSTLIAAVASAAHPRLRAFGVSVPGWDRDERRYMEEACAHLDVDLTIASLLESDFDRLTARILDTYDEPFADYSALPTMLVSEVAGSELRVVLSGDGGDELFGGYNRYRSAPTLERLGFLPPAVVRTTAKAMGVAKVGPRTMLQLVGDETEGGGHGYAALLALRTHRAAAALLGRTPKKPWALAPRQGRHAWRAEEAWRTAMEVDLAQYLPADIHTKVDRATMSVSLEARVPLLGAPVARVAEAMPANIKMHLGTSKWPLKELLLARGFSEAFVHRPKTGFSFPISEWLRRAMSRRSDYQDLIRRAPEPIDRTLSGALLDALIGGADNGHAVWTVLILSGWLERYGG